MELQFEPEVFTPPAGCGCASCQGEVYDEIGDELAEEYEYELPQEVTKTTKDYPAQPAQLCKPGSGLTCPKIPELWSSTTIAGVRFWYDPKIVGAGGNKHTINNMASGRAYTVKLTPMSWNAVAHFIGAMIGFGLPITDIATAGAGPYCRCVKIPHGVCGEGNPGACTGTHLSDHGFGDAIDIIGVKWASAASAGSSVPVTVMHSWRDSGDQGKLLQRINAILRLSFTTVLDYSRKDHRDHFHCDTNHGQARWNPWGGKDPCEPNYVMSSLKRLGYLADTKPVTWARAIQGLTAFATKQQLAVPTTTSYAAWRPVMDKLFSCIAIDLPPGCRA